MPRVWLALLLGLAVAACGGGSAAPVNGTTPPAVEGPYLGPQPPRSQYAGRLVRSPQFNGAVTSDWEAPTCTAERQRRWVASMLWEDHLFYDELPNIQPGTFSGTVPAYFDALTVQGLPQRDRFSFVVPQALADGLFGTEPLAGLGLNLRYDAQGHLRVAAVEPNGPAAGVLARGDRIVQVNGTVVGPSLTQAQYNALFASAPGTQVMLDVRSTAGMDRSELLSTAFYAPQPIPVSTVLPGNIGYLKLTDFANPLAEFELFFAMDDFAQAGVQELVVDLRYNGGGYLFIASQLAYMTAGSAATQNQVFENLIYNDKRPNFAFPFIDVLIGLALPAAGGTELPALNLSRVHILTSQDTCSASEALVMGLRGIGVEVVLHGQSSCGKPYTFTQRNNCTWSYFPIEAEGRNAQGESVPLTGLPATCPAVDDLDQPLGDPAEGQLASALHHIATGQCLVQAFEGPLAAPPAGPDQALLGRSPAQRIKLVP